MDDHSGPIGLCATCRLAHVVRARGGVTYYRCKLAATDTAYAKYPALPVLRCAGYTRTE